MDMIDTLTTSTGQKNKNLILIVRVKRLKCNLSEDMPCTLLVVRGIIDSEQCTVFIDIGAGKLWSTRNKPLPVQLNLQLT